MEVEAGIRIYTFLLYNWSGKGEKEIGYNIREMWACGKAFFGMESEADFFLRAFPMIAANKARGSHSVYTQ